MTDVIQIGKVGTLKNRHEFGKLENALESLDGRLDGLAGPYQIRRPGERFGRKRDKDETIARVRALLTDNEAGLRLVIRGSDSDEQPIAIRLTLTTEGPEVLLEAIRNLGVPYLFGAMNPAGPTGGKGGQLGGSGFALLVVVGAQFLEGLGEALGRVRRDLLGERGERAEREQERQGDAWHGLPPVPRVMAGRRRFNEE